MRFTSVKRTVKTSDYNDFLRHSCVELQYYHIKATERNASYNVVEKLSTNSNYEYTVKDYKRV